MNKEHVLTKISLGIDVVAVICLLIYFVAVAPYPPITDFRGVLVLSPSLFGIFGLVTAILGRKKNKTYLNMALIVVNVIFLCWIPIIWYGGTLLLGV